MNIEKTKGIFFNRQNLHQIQNLPFSHRNENMVILGIPYGSDPYIDLMWQEKFSEFKKEVDYFQSYKFLTIQAKAIISKSKFLPKMSYISSVLPPPTIIREKIDDRLLQFVVPHKKSFLKVSDFAAKRDMGGFGLAHITLHSDVMLMRNVLLFMYNKENKVDLSKGQFFIEFQIGHQLSALWNLPVNNDTAHAFHPNGLYRYILNFIRRL